MLTTLDELDRPVALDLYCGEGGASMGYDRAGFRVIGVDSDRKALDRYPFQHYHGDALALLPELVEQHRPAVVVGSPPCQSETDLRWRTGREYVDLLTPTLDAFRQLGLPWVIENVESTDKLPGALVLCGTHFGLGAAGRVLKRHRRFASNVALMAPGLCRCKGQPIGGVYGTGGGGQQTRGYKFYPDEAREAMGIDWMSRRGIAQAIPPAFTEYIGELLLDELARRTAVEIAA